MRRIALKLWTGMVSLVVIMLVLLWLFQVVYLKNFYLKQQIENVTGEGARAAEMLGGAWGNLNQDVVDASVEALVYRYKASIDVIDRNGAMIYQDGFFPGRSMGQGRGFMMRRYSIQKEMIGEVLAGKTITLPVSYPGYEYMMIGIPISTDRGTAGGLIVGMPLAPVNETARVLKQQMIYITVILLAASLFLSFSLSKVFTRPILEITRAAEEMAGGNLGVRLKSRSRDEIGRLAAMMNHMAEQLAKVERLRKDLVANVSHELRTPLSLIRGYAETIRDVSGENREKRDRQLGIIIEESERLGRIVDDILNLSQMQSGYIKLEIRPFMPDRTIENVVGRYDLLCESTGVELAVKAGNGAVVLADEARIEQVLYNLINNAFNHVPSGGRIRVGTSSMADYVRVEVSDTGPGISGEDLEHIWNRYYKADKSSGRRQLGTGLGLAIVKNILEAHQSRFGVESREGEGTTFWFELKKKKA